MQTGDLVILKKKNEKEPRVAQIVSNVVVDPMDGNFYIDTCDGLRSSAQDWVLVSDESHEHR